MTLRWIPWQREDLFEEAPPLSHLPLEPRYIVPTRHPAALRGRTRGGWPPAGIVPALLIETQADADDMERLRDLAQLRVPYRALVVAPREPIDLALFANAPWAWGLGYRPFHELFHLVVVRPPRVGALDLAVVRDLRDQAADAGVCFVFLDDRIGGPAPVLDGRVHDAVPWERP